MNSKEVNEVNEFFGRVSEHLFHHYLPFWCGSAVDHENGGWMAWLSNELEPDRSQPKGLIVHSRILWAFSAVHRVKPDPIYRQMAERAFDFVMNKFWDMEHGGLFWQLNDCGEVLDDSKKIYGHAFGIYALTEFQLAFGDAAALERAKDLFELIEQHAHDEKHGGYFEICRRDWSIAGPEARLSEKDPAEKKSMNNHLHVLEAYTNLHRAWKSPRIAARLRELLGIFLTRIINLDVGHMHHFFDEQWNVRSDTYTFGHDIEASWLLCEAAYELGGGKLVQAFKPTVVRMAENVLTEAALPDGSIAYEGKDRKVIDPGRECWPQAEAVVGFLNAFELSQDEKFLRAARQAWEFIETRLADRVHGEWFWKINADGKPDLTLPKVSEWKGPYHGTRACLEAMRRLKNVSAI